MMDCKRALGEANGNLDAAVDLLRKKASALLQSVLTVKPFRDSF